MTAASATKESATQGLRYITIAWLLLCVITIVSWWLSPAHSANAAIRSAPITLVVMVLGFIKCRLIIRYFMEVRSAPRWLRLATDGWLVALWVGALAIYLY
jgi:heme/copper-type cytochrome/quinol oxidase subunit 4